MAFRKKAKYLQEYDADILVIQESENLDKLEDRKSTRLNSSHH